MWDWRWLSGGHTFTPLVPNLMERQHKSNSEHLLVCKSHIIKLAREEKYTTEKCLWSSSRKPPKFCSCDYSNFDGLTCRCAFSTPTLTHLLVWTVQICPLPCTSPTAAGAPLIAGASPAGAAVLPAGLIALEDNVRVCSTGDCWAAVFSLKPNIWNPRQYRIARAGRPKRR